jgi:hypothetical protein
MSHELKGKQQNQPILQNTKLSHWTEYSQQFKNDGCDEVFA